MTAASPSGSAEPPPGASAPPEVDWGKLVNTLGDLVGDALKRISEQASHSAEHLRAGDYDRDSWLDDVKTFWTNFADDAGKAVDAIRSYVPKA